MATGCRGFIPPVVGFGTACMVCGLAESRHVIPVEPPRPATAAATVRISAPNPPAATPDEPEPEGERERPQTGAASPYREMRRSVAEAERRRRSGGGAATVRPKPRPEWTSSRGCDRSRASTTVVMYRGIPLIGTQNNGHGSMASRAQVARGHGGGRHTKARSPDRPVGAAGPLPKTVAQAALTQYRTERRGMVEEEWALVDEERLRWLEAKEGRGREALQRAAASRGARATRSAVLRGPGWPHEQDRVRASLGV